MKHIPNILSLVRLALIGVFCVFFVRGDYFAALVIYASAFFTDLLDGYLARRNNWITSLGKVLDPLADKLMLFAVLICFYIYNLIPFAVLLVVVIKDLIMIVVGGVLYLKKYNIYADWSGKIATGAFMIAIVMTFMHLMFDSLDWYIWIYYAAILLALIAFFHYGIKVIVKNRAGKKTDADSDGLAR